MDKQGSRRLLALLLAVGLGGALAQVTACAEADGDAADAADASTGTVDGQPAGDAGAAADASDGDVFTLCAGDGTTGAVDPPTISAPLPGVFVGANQHRIYAQCDLPPDMGVETSAVAQIAAMRASGIRVLRIFLHQEDQVPWEKPPATFTFEDGLGNYRDDTLQWIDRLMPALIGDADDPFDDVKLVVSLFNPLKGTPDGDVLEDVYFPEFGELGFYTDDEARAAFKRRISHVLNHRNPYVGNTAWKDLDIIAAWEPMNEPGLHTENDEVQTTTAILGMWLEEMATHIKAEDPDGTLVLSGTKGASKYSGVDIGDNLPDLMTAMGSSSSVDVFTIHYYEGVGGQVTIVSDAKAAAPAGTSVWVSEFGATRATAGDGTYRADETGLFGKLRAETVPTMCWRMGVRRADPNTFSRFTWDDEWDDLSAAAQTDVAPLATFDGGFAGSFSRNDGAPVTVSLVDDERGQAASWAMAAGFEDLAVNLGASHDVTGKSITVRIRASAPMKAEIQIKDVLGGFTLNNPVVDVTTEWRYVQIRLADLDQTMFDPDVMDKLVFFMKEGSDAGRTLLIDDLWIW